MLYRHMMLDSIYIFEIKGETVLAPRWFWDMDRTKEGFLKSVAALKTPKNPLEIPKVTDTLPDAALIKASESIYVAKIDTLEKRAHPPRGKKLDIWDIFHLYLYGQSGAVQRSADIAYILYK